MSELIITQQGSTLFFKGRFMFADLGMSLQTFHAARHNSTQPLQLNFARLESFNSALIVFIVELVGSDLTIGQDVFLLHLPPRVSVLAKLYGLDLLFDKL